MNVDLDTIPLPVLRGLTSAIQLVFETLDETDRNNADLFAEAMGVVGLMPTRPIMGAEQ